MTSIRTRAPEASSEAVRRVMQANVGRETRAEEAIRHGLMRMRFRFETNARPEPKVRCTADVVFRRSRVCVFVDGCYWHGCPTHFSVPKANRSWWLEKISDNKARDARQTRALRALGWTVVRVWEHDVTHREQATVVRIATCVSRKHARSRCGGGATSGRTTS